jgi:hypothetical protein
LTKSKDWTKNFVLKIYTKKNKKIKIFKNMNNKLFKDGRSRQIYSMINSFLKKPNYKNLNYCLDSEKINMDLV